MPEEFTAFGRSADDVTARNVWTRHLKSSVISGAESLSVTTERARRLIPTVFSRLLRSDRVPRLDRRALAEPQSVSARRALRRCDAYTC